MSTVIDNNQQELSFEMLFENDYQASSPPSSPPPKKNKVPSPHISWMSYSNDTPPKFYLNQKFDFTKIHNEKYGK